MSERRIQITNWERYQHPDVTRSEKAPPWIRLYTQLLDDDDFMELPSMTQLVFLKMLLAYAKSRRNLLGTTSALSQRFRQRVTEQQLTSLNHAGFIQFVQAERKQDASLEEKRKREEITPLTPLEKGGTENSQRATPPKAHKTSRTPRGLRRFTGCRLTMGTHGSHHVQDPLGEDKPPSWWAHPRPTEEEIMTALAARGEAA